MTRRRALLVAAIAIGAAGASSAQTPSPPAPGEYGRAPKLEVFSFETPNRQVRLEYPKRDWQIVPGYTASVVPGATSPIVSLMQRKREAAIVVEQTKLHQPLALDDITDLLGQLEADSIKERQPLASDIHSKLVEAGGRRFVIVNYGRQGVTGAERIRQYSIPAGGDLFRLTCVAAASQFARYEPVFAHVAASFTVIGGSTQ
jgi:hypothetical protein